MNFVALLLGLGIERLLTRLFHLREFRWLDPMFDWLVARLRNRSRSGAVFGIVVFTALLVLPVALATIALSDGLLQVPYFILAVLVLLFSLGPRDLKKEAEDYCAAIRDEDDDRRRRVARELSESDLHDDPDANDRRIRRAVYIQANNRIFAVVFWFLVLGPTGAWWFRVLDLMRRRLAFEYNRAEQDVCDMALFWAVRSVHGVFAWVPARLLIFGYALAGSFEGALQAWRAYLRTGEGEFYAVTNDLLDAVGTGAAGNDGEQTASAADNPAAVRTAAAMDLINRTLWLVWCPAIAIMTLTDWLS